ncbi:MAG: hypothetical protein WAT25_19425, partial [Paracoccaceae bacterium]
ACGRCAAVRGGGGAVAAFGTDDLTAISAAVSRGLFGDSPYRRGGSDRLGRAEDAPFPLHG